MNELLSQALPGILSAGLPTALLTCALIYQTRRAERAEAGEKALYERVFTLLKEVANPKLGDSSA